jgi:hypothetical protein
LNYDQKGSGNIFLSRTATAGNAYHLNYLTIPVMAGLHFGHTKNWYFNLGAYESFLLNAGGPANMAESTKSAFTNDDYGLTAGVGVKFHLNDKVKLFIEYDDQLGFRDILKNSPGDNPSNVSQSIKVGLSFAIK